MIFKRLKRISVLMICLLVLASCSKSTKEVDNSKKENKTESKTIVNESSVNLNLKEEKKALKLVSVSKDKSKVYISYEDVENIIYSSIDISSGEESVLYKISKSSTSKEGSKKFFKILADGVYKENLYVVEAYSSNGTFEVDFTVVDKDKKVIKQEDSEDMKGDSRIYSKLPYIVRNGDTLWITEEYHNGESIESHLSSFNIANAKYESKERAICNIDKLGKYNGEYISHCGAMDDFVYYQVIKYNNAENLDRGESFIHKFKNNSFRHELYSIELFDVQKPIKNRKLTFLSGDDNVLITNDYVTEKESFDSGLISVFKGDILSSKPIPNINYGSNILGAKKFKDKYFIYNSKEYFVYDKEGNKLTDNNYATSNDVVLSEIENGFCYLEKNDTKYNIKFIELD